MAISNINFKANVQENGIELKKQKGRLVIGIEGTHTLDDADILFGANESDAAENSAKLEVAIQKGGFNEIVFLNGTFHIYNPIQFYGTIRGIGNGVLGYGNFTKIRFCGSLNYFGVFSGDNMTLCDFSLYRNMIDDPGYGVYIDYYENVVIERVHFEGFDRAIHIYEGHNIKVSNCITKNCNVGIYCDDGKWVTIQDCHFENDGNEVVDVISWDEVAWPVYLISNRIIGDCRARNCYMINNDITGDGNLGNNNFTTIGATKLTEDKVKALNEVGKSYHLSSSSMPCSITLDSTMPDGVYSVVCYDGSQEDKKWFFTFELSDANSETLAFMYDKVVRIKTFKEYGELMVYELDGTEVDPSNIYFYQCKRIL
jgi:hypothetical protein